MQALQVGAPEATVRWLATVYSAAWPWSIALFIPLALLSFPSGHLPAPRWRRLVPVVAVNCIVQVLLFSSDPDPLATVAELDANRRSAPSYLALEWLASGGTVEFVSQLVLCATFLAALLGLGWRYRRGTEQVRRRLLWLLFAAAVAVVLVALSGLGGPIDQSGFPVVILTAIALIPVAMTIAVLRHRLLDIRLVWSRAPDGGRRGRLSPARAGGRPVAAAGGGARDLGAGDADRRGGVPPRAVAVAARRRPAARREPTRASDRRPR